MELQCDRGRVGAPCGHGASGRRPSITEDLDGRSRGGQGTTGRLGWRQRTDRGRPVWRQLGVPSVTERSTEVDPGATTEWSECNGRDRRSGTSCRMPTFRARSTAETASMTQVAMPGRVWDRHVPAPGGEEPTSLPRREGPTEGPRRRVPRRHARGRDGGARSSGGLPFPTEVGIGRPPRTVRGKGRQQPRGLCEHNPQRVDDHPRVLVRVTRSNNPIRGREEARPKPSDPRSRVERALVRNAAFHGEHRNARCGISRFVRSVYRQYQGVLRPPRLQTFHTPYSLYILYVGRFMWKPIPRGP